MDRNNDYGLPGGHVEEDENLEDTMQRELLEECGVSAKNMQRSDFFFHSSGKVVLAYVGTADDDHVDSMQGNLEGIPKWLTRNEFEHINIEPNYKKLVLSHWI